MTLAKISTKVQRHQTTPRSGVRVTDRQRLTNMDVVPVRIVTGNNFIPTVASIGPFYVNKDLRLLSETRSRQHKVAEGSDGWAGRHLVLDILFTISVDLLNNIFLHVDT